MDGASPTGGSQFCMGLRFCLFYFIMVLIFHSESVKAEDIQKISERMLSKRPCVAAVGDLSRFQNYDDIERAVLKRGTLKSSGRYFFNRF